MALDDEMPLAVEALGATVGQRDTMGICCFGEQGMNNLRRPMHGNLMFGALLFSTVPRCTSAYDDGRLNGSKKQPNQGELFQAGGAPMRLHTETSVPIYTSMASAVGEVESDI